MRRALIAVLALVSVFAAAALVYWQYGYDILHWGCPSQRELERPRSQDEVTAAFGEEGLRLERVDWPPELRHARAYEGARVLRHEAPGVSLTLVVCKAQCELPRSQVRPGRPRQRDRFGFSLGNNVAGWIQGSDRAADAALREPVARANDGLDATVDPSSRCYVG